MSGSGMIDGRRAELLGDDDGAFLRVDGPVAADGYSCRDADDLAFVSIPKTGQPWVELPADAVAGPQYFETVEQAPAGTLWWDLSQIAGPPWPNQDAEQFASVILSLRDFSREIALGIIMLAAGKCTEVQKLADSGRIDRDGADLFVRRYSESIADIVAALTEKKGN